MKETEFGNRFIRELKVWNHKIYSLKIHAEEKQRRGVPDWLLSIHGKFVGIEFKIMRGNKIDVTPIQQYEIDKVIESGGLAVVVYRRERDGYVCFLGYEFETIKEAAENFYWGIAGR